MLRLEKHEAFKESGSATDLTGEMNGKLQDLLEGVEHSSPSQILPSAVVGKIATQDNGSIQESIVSLERRISGLEKLIGSVSSSVDRDASVFPIESTLSHLEQRISLLDEECLEKIHQKSLTLKVCFPSRNHLFLNQFVTFNIQPVIT